jgi:predicted TIM-barrel fold metal-dependent hydrolase
MAYNRWLADFCSVHPERHAGIAIVPFLDTDEAVREIRWAKEAGLKGGILLPGMNQKTRYNDPRYEPIWSALEDLRMPVNVHGGIELPDYGPDGDAMLLMQEEVMFFSHRPLWWLLWSGVFERHPRLLFVLTEQMADWVPRTLHELDGRYESSSVARRALPLKPSEYWARQCYVGATFMSRAEGEMRREIGLGNILWGSDYPHPEGSWPYTLASLRNAYAGLPTGEVRLMVGQNAASVYGFDVAKLASVAARVGPRVDEVARPLTEVPKDYIGSAIR